MYKSQRFDCLFHDHPAWISQGDGRWVRAISSTSGPLILRVSTSPTGSLWLNAALQDRRQALAFSIMDCGNLEGDSALVNRMRTVRRVGRWANTDIWDALATAIIRQVIRAGHARRLYRETCQRFGERVTGANAEAFLFPSPEVFLELSDTDLREAGLAFKIPALRSAARFLLEHEAALDSIDPRDLMSTLQTIHRVGVWTASAAVADMTNDFSLYPYGDLAVRTWARHMDDSIDWPRTDIEFAELWHTMAKGDVSQWTLSTLAYGARHGRSAERDTRVPA